jgi:hypothetical protein
MKLSSEDLQQLIRQETSRPTAQRENCLSAELLMLAAAGELGQTERQQVTEHLMTCADCVEEYRLAHSLKDWSAQAALAIRESKSVTAENRSPEKAQAESFHPTFWQRLAALFSPALRPYAMAAGLLIVSMALVFWVVSLRQKSQQLSAQLNEQLTEQKQANDRLANESNTAAQALEETRKELEETRKQLEEAEQRSAQSEKLLAESRNRTTDLSKPQINVPIVDIAPEGSVRGGGKENIVRIPSSAHLFTLILNLVGPSSHSSYAVEISDARGKRVWSGQGLSKSPENTFTLALPEALFPAAQYHIKLFGLRGKQKDLIQDYVMRVQYY